MTAFWISHWLVVPWLFPPGICVLLGIAGICLWRFRPLLSKLLMGSGILLLWAVSSPFLAYQLLDSLQLQYPVLSPESSLQNNSNAVIVVLGGGNVESPEQKNHYTLSDITLARVRYAARLHRETGLPIIVSGGFDAEGMSQSEAALMADALQNEMGVQQVISDHNNSDTSGEAISLLPLLKRFHFNTVWLVTNASHMPRSVYLFRRQGIHVIPAPMGFEVYDTHYTLLSFFPNLHALWATNTALHEYLGLLWAEFTVSG